MSEGRIVLRGYTDEDHARTFLWLQDSELRRFTGTTSPPSPETHSWWLQQMRSRQDAHLSAIEAGGVHVGNLFLMSIDAMNAKAEVQLFIGGAGDRNKGIGLQAICLAKQRAFSEMGLHRLYAFVFDFNERARRSFEKAGFSLEGRLREDQRRNGQFADLLVLGCLDTDG